jgi:hypothetical protein
MNVVLWVMNVASFCFVAPCGLYVIDRCSETLVHIRTTRCSIPEDGNVLEINSECLAPD